MLEIRVWVHNNQWSRKNKVYGSRTITGIRVGFQCFKALAISTRLSSTTISRESSEHLPGVSLLHNTRFQSQSSYSSTTCFPFLRLASSAHIS